MSMIHDWNPSFSDQVRPIPWSEFTAEILPLYDPPLRSKNTRSRVKSILGQLAALGVTSTADLTPALVAKYIASQPASQSRNTTRGYLSYLRSLCNYAAGRRYVFISPFMLRRQWVRPSPPLAKSHHSLEEIARVLCQARKEIESKRQHSQASRWAEWRARRLFTLFGVVSHTGLRKNEALKLRVEDIDLPGRMILVRPRANSGELLKTDASAAPVPIPADLVPIIDAWLPHLALPSPEVLASVKRGPFGKSVGYDPPDPGWLFPCSARNAPWTGGSKGHKPGDALKALGVRAGVQGLTFQSLRHSWATHAESAWGLSPAVIQRVLRHTTPRTQLGYRHADLANLRKATERLGFEPRP